MPARAIIVALSVISASVGFVAGYYAPRTEAPLAPQHRASAAREAPEAPALPLPPPSSLPAPVVTPPAVAKLAPTAAPVLRAPLPVPVAPSVPEPIAAPRARSALAAFRFSGVGPAGGLRLARVPPNTLPAALGLQSGDELLSINKFRLADPEQALIAYARLRYADRLELAIQRNGRPTAIVYSVR